MSYREVFPQLALLVVSFWIAIALWVFVESLRANHAKKTEREHAWRKDLPFRRVYWVVYLLGLRLYLQLDRPVSTLVFWFAMFWLFAEVPIRAVLIPAGLVRTTYAVARVAGFPVHRLHSRLGAAFFAAQALARRPTEAGARFVERRLRTSSELALPGVAAEAFVALSRGEKARGTGILRALADFPPEIVPAVIASAAFEVLVLDAAERGAWNEVGSLAELGPPSSRTRLTRLLGAIADRAAGEPLAPSKAALWVLWALAPSRRRTLPLVRASSPIPEVPPADVAPDLTALAALARRAPYRVRQGDLHAAVRSLDEFAASPEVTVVLTERARAVGVFAEPHAIRERIVRKAQEDVADLIATARLPSAWLGRGDSADRVRSLVRAEREARVDRHAREIHRRANDEKPLPEADEYLAAGELLRAIDELRRDASTSAHHETLFRSVHRPLWSYGWWLSFRRTHRGLGRAVLTRQRELALAAHAKDTYETIDLNLTGARRDWSLRYPEDGCEVWTDRSRRRRVTYTAVIAVVVAGISLLIFAARVLRIELSLLSMGVVPVAVGVTALLPLGTDLVLMTDGFVLQFSDRSYFVRREDGLRAYAGPFGLLHLTLERSPRWLSRRLFTIVASTAEAERRAKELNARFRSNESPG